MIRRVLEKEAKKEERSGIAITESQDVIAQAGSLVK